MKLKTVALITLLMIAAGHVITIFIGFKVLVDYPLNFLGSSMGTWALMFFFFMLYKRSSDE